MNKVPRTWVTRPFGELNGFYGANIDPASYPTERFELYSIPVFPTGKPEQPLGSEVGSTKQVVVHNDVLISKINPRINRVWQVGLSIGLRQIASSEWIGFRCTQMDARYFRYYFTSPTFRDLLCSDVTGVGGSLTRAQPKRVAGFPVPVAPVNEQKRIADKLDTVLTRVDAVNTRLARVAPILKRFRQSVLAAATSGRLTEDWRKTRGGPQAEKTTLQSICQQHRVITYGVVKLGDETPGGTPCLRTSNVRWLRFELEGMKLIHPALSAEYKRTVLCGGEVLVNVRGTLGGVAVATSEMAGWNVSREVAVVPVDQKTADPAFIALWIASEDCQRWLTGVTKGVAYTGINIEDLRTLPLELPGKEEQAEIVRRVETLFAFADRLEARLQTAQTATERLTPALLAKAFRGELVPQDPNDEPASELLKRLATTASSPAHKRGRRKAADAAA